MTEHSDPVTERPAASREPGRDVSSTDPAAELSVPPAGGGYGETDANGVDRSLLRYMLSLSPLERLRLMERHARDTRLLNEYGRQHRQASPGRHR
jgi:hypothetical protein